MAKEIIDQETKIINYINMAIQNNFFGTIALKFQAGKLCSIKTETTLKSEQI